MVMNVDLSKSYPETDDNPAHLLMNTDVSTAEYAECTVDEKFFTGMSYGFFVSRLAIVSLYGILIVVDDTKRVREQFGFRCPQMILSTGIFLITDWFVENSLQKTCLLILIGVIEIIHFPIIFISQELKARGHIESSIITSHFPINYLESQTRLGIFFVIVLGESIITLLQPSLELGRDTGDIYLVNIFGLILIFAFAMQYYDKVQRKEGELHAARRDKYAGVTFMLSHWMIGYFMLITAQGIIEVAASVRSGNADVRPEGKLFLAYGCFLTSICLIFMRILHQGFAYRFATWGRILHLSARLLIAACHLFMLLATEFQPRYKLVFHSLITLFLLAFDVVCDLITSYRLFGYTKLASATDEHAANAQASNELKSPLLLPDDAPCLAPADTSTHADRKEASRESSQDTPVVLDACASSIPSK